MNTTLFWLLATLIWTLIMSFFSTQEMAYISFNKLRLGYFVKQKVRWAIWLQSLLDHPTKLFTTTLIGVNVALMISSECARRLYQSVGIDPIFAPITHVPFVLLFGELVPMFAARIHAEHMSRLGIRLLYPISKLLTPFSYIVEVCFKNIHKIVGKREEFALEAHLSREELQKLLEEHRMGQVSDRENEFIINNIFSLKGKRAFHLMEKLDTVCCLASQAAVKMAVQLFQKEQPPFILIYTQQPKKIVGMVLAQDLIRAHERTKLAESYRAVTFVAEDTPAIDVALRLRRTHEPALVVLATDGQAVGVISTDAMYDEIFSGEIVPTATPQAAAVYLEKTLSADTPIVAFNNRYGLSIDPHGCVTFAELIEQILGRNPLPDDTIFVDPVEIVVKSTSLFKAKTIHVTAVVR